MLQSLNSARDVCGESVGFSKGTTRRLTPPDCRNSRLVVDGRDAAVGAFKSNHWRSNSRRNGRTSWFRRFSWMYRIRISAQVQVLGQF